MSILPFRRTQLHVVLFAILMTGAAPTKAYTSANAYSVVGQNAPYIGSDVLPLNVEDSKLTFGATQSQATANRTTLGPSGGADSHAYAFASAGHLAVAATSSTSVKVGGIDSQGNPYERIEAPGAAAEAKAGWDDQVTINAAGLTGARGSLNAMLHLSGSVVSSADPYVLLQSPGGGGILLDFNSSANITINGSGLTWATQPWDDACAAVGLASRIACARSVGNDPDGTKSYSLGNVHDLPVTLDFTFGSPFGLSYSMIADSNARSTISAYKFLGAGEANGAADMSHTLLWGGIGGVFGANGAAVTDYSVTALSGFDYRNAAPVPEPATYALLLAGLAAIGCIRRNTRQQSE